MQSVSETVARALTRHVEKFFCLMGNGNAYFIDALERLGVPPIPVRHESGTVASADAYYRMTREVAVATATYGAGFTNTLTSLAESSLAKMPLVLVVGSAPTAGPRPLDIDQTMTAASMDVPTYTVGVQDAGTVTIQALADAIENSRPVVLAIPYDLAPELIGERGEIIPDLPEPTRLPTPDHIEAARIAHHLADAERPLILAGRGAIGARSDLLALAETLGADVVTTVPTQGYFSVPARRPTNFRDLGVCGGFSAPGALREIRRADVVFVVGAGLNQFTMAFGTAFSDEARVVQVGDTEEPTNSRVDQYCRADAADAVGLIHDKILQLGVSGRTPVVSPTSEEAQWRTEGDEQAPDGRLDPRRVMSRLNDLLPEDRVVFTDGGHFMQWPLTYLKVNEPDSHVTVGTQFQSIGLGFASAAGVLAASGERLPVLVSGDGGGLMGIADAETFVRTTRRGVVVFLNDAGYGAEVHQYAARGLAPEPMLIPDVDFAGIFRALGAKGDTVRTLADLRDFEQWIAAEEDGIYVLDCRITNSVRADWIIETVEEARRAAPHVEEMLGMDTSSWNPSGAAGGGRGTNGDRGSAHEVGGRHLHA